MSKTVWGAFVDDQNKVLATKGFEQTPPASLAPNNPATDTTSPQVFEHLFNAP
jgi:hypothetical protein